MARKAQFIPVKTAEGWRVNVPPNLSGTGTRQRRYFETKDAAEGFAEKLGIRVKNHGIGAKLLTPAQEDQAAAAFRLLDDANCQQSLSEIVGQHLARIKKNRASKPFIAAFDAFLQSKARRPAYNRSLAALRKISEPLHERTIRDITPADVETILAGMAPAYRNLRLRELRAVFNYALNKGWVDENPIERMDFLSR
jgi:hypothetical protein